MSENPQHSVPAPPAPVPPAAAPNGWAPGGYVQTAPGAPPVYLPPAAAPRPVEAPSTALGAIALIVAVCAIVVSSILSATTGFAAANGAVAHAALTSPSSLENLSDTEALALLSPVRGLVLWAEIGFWTGTLLGIWALIQGIVAIATRRGRGQGIAAVIAAAAGPIVYAVAVTVALVAGIAAAVPTYS